MKSFELLYWLAAKNKKGKEYISSLDARLHYGAGALVLITLFLDKHIFFDDKKNVITGKNPPQEDSLLELWQACTTPQKINWFWLTGKKQETALTIKDWLDAMVMNKVPTLRKIKEHLIAQNSIIYTQKKILGLFTYKSLRVADPDKRFDFQEKLRNIVEGKIQPTLQEFLLLKVIKACKIHALIANSNKVKKQAEFFDKLQLWANQSTENKEILGFLEELALEQELEKIELLLETVFEMVNMIADIVADTGGTDGGDGGGSD